MEGMFPHFHFNDDRSAWSLTSVEVNTVSMMDLGIPKGSKPDAGISIPKGSVQRFYIIRV